MSAITFPFKNDRSLASGEYAVNSLGRGVSDVTGDLTGVVFRFNEQRQRLPRGLVVDVEDTRVVEEQELQQSSTHSHDTFFVSGTLGINLYIMGAEGTLAWQRDIDTSSKTFYCLQKCVVVTGHTTVDKVKLHHALADDNTNKLLVSSLCDASNAAFIERTGSRFVSKVTHGGVVWRRIRFSCKSKSIVDELKAKVSAWVGIGWFRVSFTIEFCAGIGRQFSRDVEISVESRVAGGNPDLMSRTTDLATAMKQLEQWKASVTPGTATVIGAAHESIGDFVVPAISNWNQHDLH